MSWCKYRRAEATGETYTHEHSLPYDVLLTIKDVFRDLTDDRLLRKCLHGKTQNANKSFNNLVWNRIPKNVFVGVCTLEIGVRDAVLCFNDGAISRLSVLQHLGVECGQNMKTALTKIDSARVHKAELSCLEYKKAARMRIRNLKRKKDEKETAEEDSYGSGMF